ncbi:MAG: hypothetical protein ACI4S2_05970 [Lachnospiraceae bacterium]
MSKKEGKKVSLFEEMHFEDAAYAQAIISMCEQKKKRNVIGLIACAIVTIFDFVSLQFGDAVSVEMGFLIMIGIGVIALLIGGALKSALKTLWTLVKIGYYAIPIFPIDLIVAWVVFGFMGLMFVMFPIVFVLFERYKIWKEQKDAELFLEAYKPAE